MTPAAWAAWREAARSSHHVDGTHFRPSRTSQFLDHLLAVHRPRLWLFGHYHHDWSETIGPTRFICVGELSYVDITGDADAIIASSRH
jgi:hypothetical protein